MSQDWLPKVEKIVADVCRREGCFLYDLEFLGAAQGRTLRVYIDKDETGASIDDCSNVSKGLNLLLDVEDIVPGGAYSLEVSTPGIDRRLRHPWHFEKAVGKKIWVRTTDALETLGVTEPRWMKAKQVEDTLSAADDQGITMTVKEGDLRIPFNAIEKAKVVFEMKQPQKKKN